jgi:hypothetical protein
MHPVIVGLVAQDHVRSLIAEAEAVRLARAAAPRLPFRRRLGLRLIATGERLAPQCPGNVVALPVRGGRI